MDEGLWPTAHGYGLWRTACGTEPCEVARDIAYLWSVSCAKRPRLLAGAVACEVRLVALDYGLWPVAYGPWPVACGPVLVA